jgi:hypothetical protein
MYTQNNVLTASASAEVFGTEIGFRLNSLYDPDYTGAGHQPYFFDQIAGIYNRYRVNACTVDITFSDPSGDGMAVACQVKPSSATGGATNLASQVLSAVRERPNVVVGYLNTSGGQKLHVRKRFTIAEAEGLTHAEFIGSTQAYSALVSANPTLGPWLQVAITGMTATSTTVMCLVNLDFECEFWERNIVAQS